MFGPFVAGKASWRGWARRQHFRAGLSRRSRTKVEVKRRRKRGTAERGGREAGGMDNHFQPWIEYDETRIFLTRKM
jgi:hypothetical protein